MLKILQARLQQYVNQEFLEKAEDGSQSAVAFARGRTGLPAERHKGNFGLLQVF